MEVDKVVGLFLCLVFLVGWFIVDKFGAGECGFCGIIVVLGLDGKFFCIVVIYMMGS